MAEKKKKDGTSSKKNKRPIKNNIIIVTILVLIGMAGIVFGVNQYNGSSASDVAKTVELPTINTSISSSSTGGKFYISADVTLLFEKTNTEDYENLKNIVTEAVSGLDYDGVTGEYSINYIKEHIKSKLSDSIKSNVVANIYITDLQSGSDPIVKENKKSSNKAKWITP